MLSANLWPREETTLRKRQKLNKAKSVVSGYRSNIQRPRRQGKIPCRRGQKKERVAAALRIEREVRNERRLVPCERTHLQPAHRPQAGGLTRRLGERVAPGAAGAEMGASPRPWPICGMLLPGRERCRSAAVVRRRASGGGEVWRQIPIGDWYEC
jgi:hypothetical protein